MRPLGRVDGAPALRRSAQRGRDPKAASPSFGDAATGHRTRRFAGWPKAKALCAGPANCVCAPFGCLGLSASPTSGNYASLTADTGLMAPETAETAGFRG